MWQSTSVQDMLDAKSCFWVHVFVHTVLLLCECGILGIMFVKLASDTRTARNAYDAAQIRKLRHHVALNIFSSVLTLLTFTLTITSTYFMSRFSTDKISTILGSMKRVANSSKAGPAKLSSTVAAECALAKTAQGAVDVETLVRGPPWPVYMHDSWV
jgi:hypothetical protein